MKQQIRATAAIASLMLLIVTLTGYAGNGGGQATDVRALKVQTEPTQTVNIDAPTPTFTIPDPAPVLARLTEAFGIEIREESSGLSDISPVRSRYQLRRKIDIYEGKGTFSFRDPNLVKRVSKTEPIAIDVATVNGALEMLAQSPTQYGYYDPPIVYDAYHSLEIDIELADDVVTFFTISGREDFVPWALDLNGSIFVINSDIPTQAFKLLEPHLKRGTLRKMIDEIDDARSGVPGMPGAGGRDPEP